MYKEPGAYTNIDKKDLEEEVRYVVAIDNTAPTSSKNKVWSINKINAEFANQNEVQKVSSDLENVKTSKADISVVDSIKNNLNHITANIIEFKTANNTWKQAFEEVLKISQNIIFPFKQTIDFGDGVEINLLENSNINFNNCIISFGNGGGIILNNNCSISNFTLNKGYILIIGSNCNVSYGVINDCISNSVAIRTDNNILKNININNVTSNNSVLFGFNILDKLNEFAGKVENITYTDCKAYKSGNGNEWATGFATEGIGEIYNLSYINCISDNSMESGFHLEGYGGNSKMMNILFQNCISCNNGLRKNNATYGAGFFENEQVTYINCRSYNNITDYVCEGKPTVNFFNCITDGYKPFTYYQDNVNLFKGGDLSCGLLPLRSGMLTASVYKKYQGFGINKNNFTLEREEDNDISIKSNSVADTDTGKKSITSQLIKINPNKNYEFSADIKKDTGTDGQIIFSIAEFDKDLKKVKHYSMGQYLTPTDSYVNHKFIIGKTGEHLVLNNSTYYITATLVVGYLEGDNTNGIIGRVKNIKFIEI